MDDDARRRQSSTRRPGATVLLLLLLAVAAASSFARAEGRAGAAIICTPAPPEAGPGPALGFRMTELQKHVAFFDRDHNRILTMDETCEGLKSIGFGAADAKAMAATAHAALGPKTRPDKSNSSCTDIYIVNIHKGIHGSDTGAYNPQGRFVPAKLNEMFFKYCKTRPNAMTEAEIDAMLNANREDKDWVSAQSEWHMLYKLAKDKDGFLRKGTARAIYDGTLFYQLAAKRKTR